jgi:hypothetical protein
MFLNTVLNQNISPNILAMYSLKIFYPFKFKSVGKDNNLFSIWELYFKFGFSFSMVANGTAVEGVCVTRRNPPVDCPGCEHGVVPVGRRVWRNICHHGARGLYHDRGTKR